MVIGSGNGRTDADDGVRRAGGRAHSQILYREVLLLG